MKSVPVLLVGAAVALAISPGIATAQGAAGAGREASVGGLEEVVVTARKREETLQDVPLSISAFGEKQLEEAGFRDLQDVALYTPGLQFHKQASQRTGRINSAIRVRGMNVNSEAPAFQLATLFIDGIPYVGSISSLGFDDVTRVEVIKGPQAAYFGRNTFGGAVNYVTKDPGNEWGAKLNASYAKYGDHEFNGSIEGPLITDKLSFRVGVRDYKKGAQWTANDGGKMGLETTKSITATLVAKPIEKWTIKVRGSYLEDDDGPAATAYIPGNKYNTCAGQPAVDPQGNPIYIPLRNASGAFIPGTSSGVQAKRGAYICGAIPTTEDLPRNFISTNTTLTSPELAVRGVPNLLREVFIDRTRPNGSLDGSLALDGQGLKRFSNRVAVSTDYELPGGYTIAANYARTKEAVNYLRDFDNTDIGSFWEADPRDLDDKTYEVRISSPTDPDRRYTWLLGYSSYEQTFTGDGSGGLSISSCYLSPVPGNNQTCLNLPGTTLPNGVFIGGNGRREARSGVKTTGIFGAFSFNITDQWSVSLEGREYKDKITRFNTTSTVPVPAVNYVPLASKTGEVKDFLPRAILQWKPTKGTNLYVSYAEGILPGEINALYAFGTDAARNAQGQLVTSLGERGQYEAALPGIQDFTGPEKIKAYEIGWKQQVFDGRGRFSLSYYNYPSWENQKGRVIVNVFETNKTTGVPNLAPNARNVLVTGGSKLQGVEFEGQWLANEHWEFQGGVEWTKNEYKDFVFNFVAPLIADLRTLTGSPVLVPGIGDNMKGNTAPNYPTWKGNLVSTYRNALFGTGFDWFARGEYTYTGKSFVDESNLAWMPESHLFNARFGLEKDKLRAELFVTNLFDSSKWARASRFTDFSVLGNILFLTSAQGVLLTPQDHRQVGVRVSYEF